MLGGSRLRRASFSTSLRRKPSTRRSFRRTGWPAGVGLHGDNDRRLAGRAAAAFATRASTTERGIVDLDPTGQAFARILLHHHPHELVCELPGGVLGHTEASSRLEIPPLLCVRWVHGAEPSAQRHLGRGEIVPPSAGRALVEVAGLDDAVLLPAAAGADKAARPAPAKHSLPAPIRASVKFIEARLVEPFLKLNAIARHASTPPASARVHDLYQMPAGWDRSVIRLTFVAGAEIDAKVARKNLWSSLTIGVTGFFAPCLGVLLFARFVVGQARPARSLQHHGSSDGGGQCRDAVRFFIKRLRGHTSAESDRGGTAEA